MQTSSRPEKVEFPPRDHDHGHIPGAGAAVPIHPGQGPSGHRGYQTLLPPYKAPPLPGPCASSSSLATQGPRGTQTERWKEGCQFREVVGGDFSRSPCLCKNFKLSSCHPQHLQGQPRGWKWGIQSGREAVVQFLPLSHPTVPRCSHLLHLFWVWWEDAEETCGQRL